MDFKSEIVKLLAEQLALSIEEITTMVSVPPNPAMGDFAFPCFKLGKNGKEEAEKLKQKIQLPSFVSKIQVAGPYLNFFFNHSVLTKETILRIAKEKKKYGNSNEGKGKTIVIDMSSPNIAKPFGIGHLRSTIIGNAIRNILTSQGYKLIRINHLGDWGTQFGKLIVAFKRWGDNNILDEKPIIHLLDLYVKFHEVAEQEPSLEDEARLWFKKLEDGDKEALRLWKKFNVLSLKEFKKIYKMLGVEFEAYSGESFYNNQLESTIKLVEKAGITEVSEGALIVNLERYSLPPVILRKSDGATLYVTRDIAAAIYRKKTYKFDRMLYEVGAEQKLHFQQLFKVLELMGYDWSKDCVHIDHGLYLGTDGKKFSTRRGKTVFMIDVLQETISLAKKIIEEKNPTLKHKDKVAQAIGVGAIIFGDLFNDRSKDMIFDIEKFTSFDGETGPYIQYTHARACSILSKVTLTKAKVNYSLLNTPPEHALITALNSLPVKIKEAAAHYKPHLLCHYLLELSQKFNEFYHTSQVISEDKELMKARLTLVDATRQVLANGLNLLGIHAPEEM